MNLAIEAPSKESLNRLANLVIATAARVEAEGIVITYSRKYSWVEITGGSHLDGEQIDLFLQGHDADYLLEDAELIYTKAEDVIFDDALAYVAQLQYLDLM